jgi:hypothetical protein
MEVLDSLGAMTTKKCESIQAAVIMPNKRRKKAEKKNRNVRIKLNLHVKITMITIKEGLQKELTDYIKFPFSYTKTMSSGSRPLCR